MISFLFTLLLSAPISVALFSFVDPIVEMIEL